MRNAFMKDQRIEVNGREFQIEGRLPGGEVVLKDTANNSVIRPMQTLVDELFKGNLKMLDASPSYKTRKAANVLSEDFTQLPEEIRAEAKRRYAYVKELTAQNPSKSKKHLNRIIEAVSKAIGDANPPSAITLYRWWKGFISSGENIRSLVPLKKMRGNRRKRISPEIEDIIEKAIDERYLSMQRLTVNAVHSAVIARTTDENRFRDSGNKLKLPNIAAIRRRIARLNPYEVTKARHGKKAADAKFGALKQGVITTRPLERVEMDHTKLDLFVIDTERGMPIGRPWLTTAIDVYSKTIFGVYLSFNPPSYLSVMQCLLHGIMPKTYVKEKYPEIKNTWDTYGIPETAVVDNGKEFHSTHFEDACLQLGIVIQYSPVKLPWYRPTIERYFGTLNKELLHGQPGTSFSNIIDKADYDPLKNAVIDFKTLLEIVHKWVIDIYHQKEHRGIKNIPALTWKTGVEEFPPMLPPNREELQVLLGMIVERSISAAGIELHGLFYNSDELAALRCGESKKMRVKLDPTDLSMIYVFDDLSGTFIPVPALNQIYSQGLSLWQHNVIKAYARKYIKENADIAALARAKEEIRRIVAEAWQQTKKNATRQKMARYSENARMIEGRFFSEKKGMDLSPKAKGKIIPLHTEDSMMCGISDAEGLSYKEDNIEAKNAIEIPALKKRGNGKKKSLAKNFKQNNEPGKADRAPVPVMLCEDEDLDMSGWSADYSRPEAQN